MAKQAATSGLLAKLGSSLVTAVEAHKGDETKTSNFGDLPAGVEGVARLTECKFGVYEKGDHKGQFYFFAQGSVLTPLYFTKPDGTRVKVAGKFTKIGPEPICDTPAKPGTKPSEKARLTLADHVAWTLNQLRLLGAKTNVPNAAALMEGMAEALKKTAPCFEFRTSSPDKLKFAERGGKVFVDNEKGKQVRGPYPTMAAAKNAPENKYVGSDPMVYHNWNGVCVEPADTGTGDMVTTSGDAAEHNAPEVDVTPPAEVEAGPETQAESTEGAGIMEETDLDVLASLADNEDNEEAKVRLKALAAESGCDMDAFIKAKTWSEGADMVRAAQEAGGGEGELDYEALGKSADEGDEEAAGKLTELWEQAGHKVDAKFKKMSYADVAAQLVKDAGGEAGGAALEKGQCGTYTPVGKDPKTKKPWTAQDVEIEAVNDDGTLNLLSSLDRKTRFKNVAAEKFQLA